MSTATSDDFLSGQGIPVALPEIEPELARLWGPAAEREGGPTDLDSPTVTRVSLADLVVACLGDDAARLDGVLDTVVARHPCRAIVLRPDGKLGRAVSAEISALCHLPAPGLPQVCSERIVLRAGREGFDLLPGAIRPLLESGLPVVLWWVGDPRPVGPLFRELAGEATRLILDLPDPEPDASTLKAALDPSVHRYGRDIAWFGIARWRELVAQFFDSPGAEAILGRIETVSIDAITPRPHLPRAAAWLAAWLAGQLGWEPNGLAAGASGGLTATFRRAGGEVAVTIRTEIDPDLSFAQIAGVGLTATASGEGESYRLIRLDGRSDEVCAEVCSATLCSLPRVLHAPELDAARRVAAGLESAREDPPYRKALPHLLWLAGA